MEGTGHAPLVGRDKELGVLDGLLTRSSEGRLGFALLKGEAGIGKTRLVEAALTTADRLGFKIFRGRCEAYSRERPFAPLIAALGSPDDLMRLSGSGSIEPEGSDVHHHVIDELVELMERSALEGPTLISIEDLHWSDNSTVHALQIVTHRLADLPLAIVVSTRPTSVVSQIDSLFETDEEQRIRMTVGPLDIDAISEIVEKVLDAKPTGELIATLQTAAGNPFFVLELLDSWVREKKVVVHEGIAEGGHPSLTPALRSVVIRKLDSVSGEALHVLQVGSILGANFSVTDLSVVVARPVVELMSPIEECLRAGLLHDEGGVLRFRHDIIHEALYLEIPPSVRSGLHADIARALQQSGIDQAALAHHYSLAGEPGDTKAIESLRAAANVPSLSVDERAVLLRRALELVERSGDLKDRITTELADALVWGARPPEGVKLANAALAASPAPEVARRLRLSITRGLWVQAAWEALLETTEVWVDRPDIDIDERGLLIAHRAMAGSFCNRPVEELVDWSDEALRLGEQTNNAEVVVNALIAQIMVRGDALGRVEDEIPLARRAVDVAETSRRPEVHRLEPRIFLGVALHSNSRFEEAEKILLEGLQSRERSGTPWDLSTYQGILAITYFKCGRWDDALNASQASALAAEETGTAVFVSPAHQMQGEISFYRGDLQNAQAQFEIARSIAGTAEKSMDYPATLRLLLAMARDDVGRITSEVSSALQNQGELGLTLNERLLIELIPFLLAKGNRDLSSELIEGFEQYVAKRADPQTRAHVAAGRAALEDDTARYAEAHELLRSAGLWQASGAAELLASALARQGRVGDARPRFDEALGGYESLGAARLAARALATMRRLGMPVGARGPRKRPRFGWDALTDAERRVVSLAVEGMTNREIAERLYLSRYTVMTHLKSVFVKLGIKSRVELATSYATSSKAQPSAARNPRTSP